MPKIQRKTQKIFCNSADSDQIAVFGSMSTGNPVYSNDVEQLQSNEAYEIGWDAATLEDKAPFMEEMNGMQYGITKQLAYNFQEGIPEYDAGTTYYVGSICKVLEEGKPVLYTSLTDENLGNNPITDATNWEELKLGGGGLEIGDIGIAPLGIDETKGKRRYLNGQIIIQEQYKQFTAKVKLAVALYPSLACTESEWQTTATMTVGGQVGKFVVDDEAGTIRLPKIIMPIQGLTNLANLAEIVEAGLPTHTHTRGSMNITGSFNPHASIPGTGGAFYISAYNQRSENASGNNNAPNVSFDASRSWTGSTSTGNYSSNIQSTDTVQQEQIQYPYFIQVATGAETEDNIINEIELNNPYTLFDSKFTEAPLYNVSWLLANGSYNGSNAVHPSAYQALLVENNTEIEVGSTVNNYTKRGISVKLSTETYTDYDFVLNTANETFRLPIKLAITNRYLVEAKQATSDDPTWYNLYSDGWCEQGGSVTSSANVTFLKSFSNANYTINGTLTSGSTDNYQPVIITNRTATGCTINNAYSRTVNWQANGYVSETVLEDLIYKLYFYVGETVQNANLINAGRIEEKLSDCVNRNDMAEVPCITETYVNGASWYRVYSDGWCEQGGIHSGTSGYGVFTVNFVKTYTDTNYTICIGGSRSSVTFTDSSGTSERGTTYGLYTNKTVSSFGIQSYTDVSWYACGYIA